ARPAPDPPRRRRVRPADPRLADLARHLDRARGAPPCRAPARDRLGGPPDRTDRASRHRRHHPGQPPGPPRHQPHLDSHQRERTLTLMTTNRPLLPFLLALLLPLLLALPLAGQEPDPPLSAAPSDAGPAAALPA